MVNARIQSKRDTTENWNKARGFIPLRGEIIIYEDFSSYTVTEYGKQVTKLIPNIKIGDGKAYVQDLPFVDEEVRNKLMEHIEDQDIHVTLGEKAFWNNKVNIEDYHPAESEIIDDNLVFNRN